MESSVLYRTELHEAAETERVALGLLRELADKESELYRLFYIETGLTATPLEESAEPIGEHQTFVKKDYLQGLHVDGERLEAGSFKLRGALLDALLTMGLNPDTEKFVTASHGNHALGLAIATKYLGKQVEIHCPRGTHEDKIAKLEALGAVVVTEYQTFEDSVIGAELAAEQPNVHMTHPFNDANVIAGQGTAILETYWQLRALHNEGAIDLTRQRVVMGVAVAGGGLYTGCQLALQVLREQHATGAENIFILGAQKENCDAFIRCLEGNTSGKFNAAHFAQGEFEEWIDSTAVTEVGTNTLQLAQQTENALGNMRRVSSRELAEATLEHAGDIGGPSEPAASLARAGLKQYAEQLAEYCPDADRPILVDFMCGGPNVTEELFVQTLSHLPEDKWPQAFAMLSAQHLERRTTAIQDVARRSRRTGAAALRVFSSQTLRAFPRPTQDRLAS